MMGRRSGGNRQLFYSFNLDDHVPSDHLLRGIDRFLDLGELRRHLAPFYSHTGRPSVDPELMVKREAYYKACVARRYSHPESATLFSFRSDVISTPSSRNRLHRVAQRRLSLQ